jgi:hypothetical protein
MKKAKLVTYSFMTRVIVDESHTEDEIIRMSKHKIFEKVKNELGENLEEIVDDEECPFGTFDTDNPTIEDVIIFPKENLYIVFGKGMPVQVINYDEFGEWNCVKDNDGNEVFDIQIDYDDSWQMDNDDDYWQFQFVDLIHDENGDLKQGLNWDGVKPKIIHKTNSTIFMANLYQDILKSS